MAGLLLCPKRVLLLTAFLHTFFVPFAASETQITTFEDDACHKSQQYFTAVDGYPDGVCTNIESASDSSYSSFMVDSLDSGCAVTIYGSDTSSLSCSATVKEVAEEQTCYNSTWVYLSVDGCTKSSTSSTSSASASATTTATGSSKSNDHADAIGGSIGGVAGVAALVGIGYFMIRRQRRRARNITEHNKDLPLSTSGHLETQEAQGKAIHELHPESQWFELEHGEAPVEIAAQEKVEMEAHPPLPSELDGGYKG